MAAPKQTVLSENQLLVIEYLILNRFKKPSNKFIADTLGLQGATVSRWRGLELFQEELDRRTSLYKANFDDVQLADRKERVVTLQKLFDLLGDEGSTQLKLKILQEIRQETGGNSPIQVEMHHSLGHGPQLPPRADSYEEWCDQNRQMMAVEADYVEMERANGKVQDKELLRQGIIPEIEGQGPEEGALYPGKADSEGNGCVN
jgi:hypothetical protein